VNRDIEKFIKIMNDSPCCTKIPITAIPDYYNAVEENLRKQGHTGSDLTSIIRSELRGICPECCAWQDSTALFMPSMVSKIGKERSLFTNYGSISRMGDGLCSNTNCNSKHITIIWKGDSNIKALVNETVHNEISKNPEAPFNHFLRPDVLNYVADAIWLQKRKENPHHIYTGHRSREGDLQTWVSVMPWLPTENVKGAFPNGYCAFLEALRAESNNETEDITVMHWIYGCGAGKSVLYFSFIDSNHVFQPLPLLDKSARDYAYSRDHFQHDVDNAGVSPESENILDKLAREANESFDKLAREVIESFKDMPSCVSVRVVCFYSTQRVYEFVNAMVRNFEGAEILNFGVGVSFSETLELVESMISSSRLALDALGPTAREEAEVKGRIWQGTGEMPKKLVIFPITGEYPSVKQELVEIGIKLLQSVGFVGNEGWHPEFPAVIIPITDSDKSFYKKVWDLKNARFYALFFGYSTYLD
jgi:hypothetical protein